MLRTLMHLSCGHFDKLSGQVTELSYRALSLSKCRVTSVPNSIPSTVRRYRCRQSELSNVRV